MPTARLNNGLEPPEPITLAEANVHLRCTCSDEDAYVQSLITVARVEAENRLQRALVPSQWRLSLDAFPPGNEAISLVMPPVASVESVTYWRADGTQATMAPSAYLLDNISEPARLVPDPGTSWPTGLQQRPGAVVVEYTAGYMARALPDSGTGMVIVEVGQEVTDFDWATARALVPKPIIQWMLLAICDMYERRSRSDDRPAVPQHFADSLLDVYRIWTL